MRICVYCASSEHCDPIYHEAAATLGRVLAEAGCTIVYGGGAAGLMGSVADAAPAPLRPPPPEPACAIVYGGGAVGLMRSLADAALAAGGDVIGIIPRFMT